MNDLESSLLNAGAINDLLEKTERRRHQLHCEIGKHLKKWRLQTGILGKVISKKLGISTGHYFNLEGGRQQFSNEMIGKVLNLIQTHKTHE